VSVVGSQPWETFESRILFAIPVVKFTFDDPVITNPDTGVQTVKNTGSSGTLQDGTLAGATVVTTPRDESEPDPALRPLSPQGGGFLELTGTPNHLDVGSVDNHATWLDPILVVTSSLAYWIRVRGQVGPPTPMSPPQSRVSSTTTATTSSGATSTRTPGCACSPATASRASAPPRPAR